MEIFEQLGIEWRLLCVNAAGFLLLLWLLRKFAFGPIGNILAERESEVQQNLSEAEQQRETAARDKQALEGELSRLDQRAQEIMDQAREEAGQQRTEIVSEAREESERLVAEGRAQVATAEEEARQQLRAETGQIAAELSAQALRQSMTEERQAALVDAFIEDLRQRTETEGRE